MYIFDVIIYHLYVSSAHFLDQIASLRTSAEELEVQTKSAVESGDTTPRTLKTTKALLHDMFVFFFVP